MISGCADSAFRIFCLILLLSVSSPAGWAGILGRGPARMVCHRTAGTEMPENTLESLELAARMGCGVVEVDVRITMDGEPVLNHDGFLERMTNGFGTVETSYFEELKYLDFGSWMGSRFTGLKVARLVDALHLAKKFRIGLVLDLKDRNSGPAILALLREEHMLHRVRFGGEWNDVKRLAPAANEDPVVSIEPPVTREQVERLHGEGKVVLANFSANGHEMDLSQMRAAVAAGVDWINVDDPRLGADAIGHPVAIKIAALLKAADRGPAMERAKAILTLAHYPGFPFRKVFERWLRDPDNRISRAAAVALLIARPAAPNSVFLDALNAKQAAARKNAAWVLGLRAAPAVPFLLPLLKDQDAGVLQETLLALSRCPGNVPAGRIEPFLKHRNALVRGAAALALARHHPKIASKAIRQALRREEDTAASEYAPYVSQQVPHLSREQIAVAVSHYRALMKMVDAGRLLNRADARAFFEHEAFRSVRDYSSTVGPVAGGQLWDRVASDPRAALAALHSKDSEVADRAEWILIQAGPAVLPAVRPLLEEENPALRDPAIRIVAWQYDLQSLPALRRIRESAGSDSPLAGWAIRKIQRIVAAMQ